MSCPARQALSRAAHTRAVLLLTQGRSHDASDLAGLLPRRSRGDRAGARASQVMHTLADLELGPSVWPSGCRNKTLRWSAQRQHATSWSTQTLTQALRVRSARAHLRGLHGGDAARLGVPAVEVALGVAHDDHVAPGRDRGRDALRRAAHQAPRRPLGLRVRHLNRRAEALSALGAWSHSLRPLRAGGVARARTPSPELRRPEVSSELP